MLRWTSAILLGSLVLFSIAKPRIQQRLDEIQQRTTFQNGFMPPSYDGEDQSQPANSGQPRASTLGGVQIILFSAFLVSWFLAMKRVRAAQRSSDSASTA